MKDSIRTPAARLVGWLTISGSLVCMTGCAPLAAVTPGPANWQSHPPAGTAAHSSAPSARPTSTNVTANDTHNATAANGSNREQFTANADGRYVARQFPQTNSQPPNYNFTTPPGPPLPPGSSYNVSPPNPNNSSPGGAYYDVAPDPYAPVLPYGSIGSAIQGPRVREADLIINGFPARTGRIMLGGAVNSDAGVTGQITIDERNFDISRWPRSFQDLFSGTAFRGAGQTFRIEAAPGTDFKRYTAQFVDPNLLGYQPVSMSVSGFLYDRRFTDWDEERLGGRLAFGYRVTPDLSLTVGVSGQNVDIATIRTGPTQLTSVIGDNEIYTGEVSLKHDTRNSPIQSSQGHYFEFKFEEAFGDFDYARFETEFRQYWQIAARADGSGKQTVSYSTQVGFSGDNTPIFENFFAGGYATLRGFDFRGASPVDPTTGVELGGRFQWLNSVEYMFPITADDAFRGVTFVDFGTVEQDIKIDADNFRVAPGVGLRVAIPMLGPAPLAFDFAYPVAKADTDDRRVFSFYMSMIR